MVAANVDDPEWTIPFVYDFVALPAYILHAAIKSKITFLEVNYTD